MRIQTDLVVKVACFLIAVVLLPATLLMAEDISVNCGVGETIRAALARAKAGDRISLSGTCREHVDIRIDGLTLDGQNTATVSGPNADTNVIQAIGVRGVMISRMRITGGRDGVSFYGVQLGSIWGNTIENTGRDGIQIQRSTSFTEIVNNLIQNNPRHGVMLNEGSQARLGFGYGIEADSETRPNLIQGNGGHGIHILRASNSRIHGNWVRNNRQHGINVEQFSYADISNNAIEGNTLNGIHVRQNSGVNLGQDTGNNSDQLPNASPNAPNGQWGIEIIGQSYADGRLGSLTGVNGPRRFTPDPSDSLLPVP